YSNWLEWSGCNESPYCGHTANQTRTRNCTIDGLVQPDETCLRSNFTWATNETQSCFNLRTRCFRWTEWGDWTVNSTACETFQEYKERFCQIDSPLVWFGRPEDELDYKWVNVSASHNLTCSMTTDTVHGEVLEVIVRTNVTNIPCFVDPVTQWTDWSDCDRPCGTGNKIRTRDCQGDIDDCKAYHFKEKKICNTDLCPVNAVWTLWTDWTSCSGSCGTGSQIRTRFCSPPQHGGAACGEPVPEDYGEMIFKHVENRD
uniref:Uncharacterized protein n=2 Tax=Clytia hemisphaerica TaxID=252671 RepID=A0A7M5U135_9CNID